MFSDKDIQKIAAHGVWSGPEKASTSTGSTGKGGLYWGPIIGDLSGARREEIFGMKLDEVVTSHEVPYFKIQKNSNRTLKTISSERVIPLHSRLIELGFLDYIQSLRESGETDLFPDLKPNCSSGSFGGVFYKDWKKLLDTQLGSGLLTRK